ncbi:hypothetical protein DSO57_1039813 [Entomophthora muscae]|uniref:Uncharacterized protein n=1 Tax=Entomophthora muscae TaxID=34485 RepID=A0ACC2T8C6_9FUNG|nr:hypothetical protein DSO57_1039813 [Entomophthora muscae]
MKKLVGSYIIKCLECCQNKTSRQNPQGLLQPLPIPPQPWSSTSMDFIVELPKSQVTTEILVVVDRLTKYGIFIPFSTASAEETAQMLLKNVFAYHGIANNIVLDQGAQFTSKFWSSLMKGLGVKTNLSTSFHPQTD